MKHLTMKKVNELKKKNEEDKGSHSSVLDAVEAKLTHLEVANGDVGFDDKKTGEKEITTPSCNSSMNERYFNALETLETVGDQLLRLSPFILAAILGVLFLTGIFSLIMLRFEYVTSMTLEEELEELCESISLSDGLQVKGKQVSFVSCIDEDQFFSCPSFEIETCDLVNSTIGSICGCRIGEVVLVELGSLTEDIGFQICTDGENISEFNCDAFPIGTLH